MPIASGQPLSSYAMPIATDQALTAYLVSIILARWKEHCEGWFTKYDSIGANTTECDDNEQGNSSETTDEDDDELIPLRSEVELTAKQLFLRMAEQQDIRKPI